MDDFIFGRLEADEGLQAALRQQQAGLRHRYDITPLQPRPHEHVRLRVHVGPAVLLDRITAYVTFDGSEPAGSRGVAQHGVAIPLQPAATTWLPLHWDYGEIWQATIPGQSEGAYVRYRIEGWRSWDPAFSLWASEPHLDGTPEKAAIYGYSVDDHRSPAWAHEAVIYQIFVDRFAPSTSAYLPPARLNRRAGGHLAGVRAQLPYLAALGITAIWLTPIFSSPSYHGYDVSDYFQIDPHVGSKDDLRALVAAAHDLGIRVILDFVANHTSREFAPFRQALADPASPYRRWYEFDECYKNGYRCFFDVPGMPQLALDQPAPRAYVLEAAQYWLREFGIDGYRLDYAAGPSHDFWVAFRRACKAVNPDCWLVGEVTMGSEDLRSYAGRLDGCLDFNMTRQIRRLLRSAPDEQLPAFAASLSRAQRYFPPDFTRPTFLDNHDMNRMLFMLGDDKRELRLAAGLLFSLGSTPILYYGTEVGLSQPRAKGSHREESRHPMLWGAQQDRELLRFFRELVHWRRRHPATVYGDYQDLHLDATAGTWLVQRRSGDDVVLVAVNLGRQEAGIPLPSGNWFQPDGAAAPTTLPPRSVCLLAKAR